VLKRLLNVGEMVCLRTVDVKKGKSKGNVDKIGLMLFFNKKEALEHITKSLAAPR
jgi:hypothetical protein